METIDTSFLQRLLTELPLTALVVWLVVKLNAQKKEAVENIVSGFLKVFEDERNAHREQVQKIIELLRNH